MYRSVILHVSLASTKTIFVLSCFACGLLQRKKVSPKGLTFVSFAVAVLASATSLAERRSIVWVQWYTLQG